MSELKVQAADRTCKGCKNQMYKVTELNEAYGLERGDIICIPCFNALLRGVGFSKKFRKE